MANLKYRIRSDAPIPGSTQVLTQGLTSEEIDGNFRSLDVAKVERVGEETITGSLTVDNIKTDLNTISSVNTNGNINLEPNGTGNLVVYTDTIELGGSSEAPTTAENVLVTTRNASDLTLNTNNGASSGYITIFDAANSDITIEPNGTGNVNLVTDTVSLGSLNENSLITTQGTGDLTLNTNSGTNSGNITIFDGANANIELQVNGSGTVVVNEAGNAADVRIEGDTDVNLVFVDGSADRVAIGTNAPTNKFHIQQTTATTNAVTDVFRIDSQSSGTPAVGIGVGMEFAVETAAGNTEVGATIEAVTTDVTLASEDFDLVFRTMIAGAAVAQVGKLNNSTLQIGATGVNTTLTTLGTADLTINTNSGTDSGSIVIPDGVNQNISIEPNGTGNLIAYTDRIEVGGSSGSPSTAEDVTITTRNASDLTLTTNNDSNSGNIKIFDGANGNIELQVNGTGVVVVNEAGNAADFRVEGDTDVNLLFVDGSTDRVAVGTSTPTNKLHVQQTSATTNAVTDVLRLDSQSTGAPAVGIGVGMEFAVETAAGNTEVGAAIEAVVTDVTATSEDFDLVFRTMIAGAAVAQVGKLNNNTLQIGATGVNTKLTTLGTADLTLDTNSGTNSGNIKIFDGANGNIELQVNGTGVVVVNEAGNAADVRIEGDTDVNLVFVDGSTDRVAVGTDSPSSKLHVQQTSATTNAVTDVLRLDFQSSGTPAVGIGVGMEFAIETSAGNTEVGAAIEAVTTDVAAGSEDFDLVFRTMIAGAAAAQVGKLNNSTLQIGANNTNTVLTTQGTSDLTINTNAGTDSGNVKIFDGANANIELQVNGTGVVVVNEAGNAADVRIEGDTDVNLVFVDGSADRVAVGTSSPQNKFHIQQTSATTNTVTDVLRLDSQSSGTPAAGIGVGIEFAVETAAGNTEVGASIAAITTDVTAASEDFDLVFRTMIAGAAAAQVGKLNNSTLQIGATGVNTTLTTLGTADLTINTNAGTNSGSIVIPDGANQSISIEPNGTGNLIAYTDRIEIGGSSGSPSTAENVTITTRNASDLTLTTNNDSNSGNITIFDGANGNIELQVNGSGTVVVNEAGNAADVRIEGDTDTNLLFVDGSADRVAVGTNAPTNKLHVQETNASTNVVTDVLRLDIQSSGTPDAGIGVGMEFAVETAAGNTEVGASIEAVATDVTAASEDFDLVFRTMIAGAAAAQVGKLNNSSLQIGASGVNTTLTTQGTADLVLNTNAGTNSGDITIADGVNGNIVLNPNGSGLVNVTKNLDVDLDVNIDGGDITTSSTTFNIVNAVATTLNIGSAASTARLGATSGTLTLGNPTVVGTQTTQNLWNSVATTVNAFGAATAIDIGATTGTTSINHNLDVDLDVNIDGGDLTTNVATFNVFNTNATTINAFGAATAIDIGAATGTVSINNALVDLDGDLNVDGGDITTNLTSFNLINATATTLNIGSAASTARLGATTGTLTIGNPTVVGTQTTQTLWDTVATTVNAFRTATNIDIGATTGTTSINNNLDVDLDVNIDGGDLTTNQTSFNIINANATTLNIGSAASTARLGATSGTLTLGNPTVVGTQTTQNLWNTVATSINFGGAATAIDIGATTGTTSINHNLDVDLDVNIDGGDLTTNLTSFNVFNTNATTINAFGAANTITVAAVATDAISNVSRTSNVATVTTSAAHGLIAGDVVSVDCSNSTFNESFIVLSAGTTGSTLVYPNVGGNVTSVAATGTVTYGITTIKNNLKVDEDVYISKDLILDGDLLPSADNTSVVGNVNYTWSNGQFTDLTIDSVLTVRAAIDLADNDILRFGDADDWEFFHNGTANYMDLNVGDFIIRDNTTTRFTFERTTGKLTTTGNVEVQGGDLLTNQTTFNIINATATTVNAFGAATTINMGANSGTVTVGNPTVVGTQTTQNLWNTTATTVNAFGAATSINMGANSGTATIGNPTVVGTQTTQNLWNTTATTVNAFGAATNIDIGAATGTVSINNALVDLDGDLNVDGGDITTNLTSFNLINSTATTLNIGSAASTARLGATSGTLTLGNPTVVGTQTTQTLWNTVATTINFGGAATNIDIGATTGTTSINHNLDVDLDVNIDGGDLTTNLTSFNIINANATTLNIGSAASTARLGATSGTLTLGNPTVVGTQTTQTLWNTVATTVNAFGVAASMNLGANSGTATIGNPTVVGTQTTQNLWNSVATTVNAFGAATNIDIGATTGTVSINNALVDLDGDLNVDGGDITTNLTSFNLINDTATTLNIGSAASTARLGATSGTLTLGNPTVVGTQTTQNLWDTVATTVNAFRAATNIDIGAATGTTSINHNLDVDLDVNIDGGDLTTNLTSFNVFNTNATTINAFGTAHTINVGNPLIDSISNVSRTSNVATITTSAAHGLNPGDIVSIDCSNSTFNESFVVLSAGTTGSTIVYPNVGGNVVSTGATGTVTFGVANIKNSVKIDEDLYAVKDIIVGGEILPRSDNTGIIGNANYTWSNGQFTDLTIDSVLTVRAAIDLADNDILRFGDSDDWEMYHNGTNNVIDMTVGNLLIRDDADASDTTRFTFERTTGKLTTSGDIEIQGGDLLTNQTTFNVIDTTATTVNAFRAATAIDIGATTGTTSINHNLDVDLDVNIDGGDLTTNVATFNVFNTNATTINAFGAATNIDIGATTGTTSINHNLDVDLDVNIDGGDLTTNQTSFNIINANATTLNIGSAASTARLGATTGTLTLGNPTVVGTQTTQTLWDTVATTVNAFGAATTLNLGHDGASASTTNIATGATGNTLTKTINLGTAGAAGSTTNVNVGSANTRTVGILTIETKDIQFNGSGNIILANSGTTKRGIIGTAGDNDQWFVGGGATAADGGFLEIATGDNGNAAGAAEPIHVRQYNGGNPLTGTLTRTATLLDNNGNTTFPGIVTASSFAVPGLANGSISLTTTSTTQTAIHNVAFADYDGGKYVIQAKRGTDRQITEVLVTHDGSTAIATEYAVLMTGPRLFTVDVDINSTNMRVLITATAATSTTYRVSFSLLTA